MNQSNRYDIVVERDQSKAGMATLELLGRVDDLDALVADSTALVERAEAAEQQTAANVVSAGEKADEAGESADRSEAAAAIAQATSGAGFPTRGALAEAVADGSLNGLEEGQVVPAATWPYRKATGATAISDIPGWLPATVWTVCHYGAGQGDDDTAGFSAAAASAPAEDNVGAPWSSVIHAEVATVVVPAGEYTLTELVDTYGREITWVLDAAAIIDGIEYINGTVARPGRLTRQYAIGTLDQAVGAVFSVGGAYSDKPAPITGVTSTQQAADYAQRDLVALAAAAYPSAAIIDVATATYTATTATIAAPSSSDRKRLRKGAIIYTKHGTRCAGILVDWNADASVLTVAEWRAKSGSSAVTPANGSGLTIGADKLWAINGVVQLTSDGFATQAIGAELSVRNQRGDSDPAIDNETNRVWGYLSAAAAEGTPGYYKSHAAYMARGAWIYGYASHDQDVGYYYRTTQSDGVGLKARAPTTVEAVLLHDTNDQQRFKLLQSGDVLAGTPGISNAGRYYAWSTSGLAANYDVRLLATGGTSTDGQGALTVAALAGVTVTGPILVSADSVRNLGDPSQRWANVYATRFRPGAGAVQWTSGVGTPEGNLIAPVGSLYTRTDGGAGTTLYIKETGTGNTGWVAK